MKAIQCFLSLDQVPQNHMVKSLLSYDNNKENRFELWRQSMAFTKFPYASVTGLGTFSKKDHESPASMAQLSVDLGTTRSWFNS